MILSVQQIVHQTTTIFLLLGYSKGRPEMTPEELDFRFFVFLQ